MATTETESTIGTAKIYPIVTIVAAAGGATYDFRSGSPTVAALATAAEGASGALILGKKTEYKMQSDGFEITAVEGNMDNRDNPSVTYQMKAIVPAPDAAGSTVQDKRDDLMAVNEGGLYDAYGYDGISKSDGWACKMINAKVEAIPKTTPEGEMFEVTITTQNHDDYDSIFLPSA